MLRLFIFRYLRIYRDDPLTTYMIIVLNLQAIMLPEVLFNVMSFLPMSDIAACARVCQSWLDPAIRRLYRELDFGLFVGMLGLPFTYDVPDPTKGRLVCYSKVIFMYYGLRLQYVLPGHPQECNYPEVALGPIQASLRAH